MTLDAFNQLDLNSRLATTWTGTHLETRVEENYRVLVYSLPDFYAEVFYNAVSNEIVKCRGFISIQLLAPYLAIPSADFGKK